METVGPGQHPTTRVSTSLLNGICRTDSKVRSGLWLDLSFLATSPITVLLSPFLNTLNRGTVVK
jgi:hypothetical protein